VTCHERFASKTLASPAIVSGLCTREFASGCLTTIEPREEMSGVGTGVGVGVGGGEAVATLGEADGLREGVGLFTTIVRSTSQAPRIARTKDSARAVLTSA